MKYEAFEVPLTLTESGQPCEKWQKLWGRERERVGHGVGDRVIDTLSTCSRTLHTLDITAVAHTPSPSPFKQAV
jgi:hypothetical protein